MSAVAWCQGQDQPELPQSVNGGYGRHRWHRRRGTPDTNDLEQPKKDSCPIFVSTGISREISDSPGVSAESPRVETVISSSSRPKSLNLNGLSLTPSRRYSLNSTRPFPSIRNSSDTQMLRIETSSSNRSSITDPGRVEGTLSDRSDDMCRRSHSRPLPSLKNSSSTENETTRDEILASGAPSECPMCLDEPSSTYPFWTPNIGVPNADSSASNVVFPTLPASGKSSPSSNLFFPMSPINETMSPPSQTVFSVTATSEDLDLRAAKHHEDEAAGWVFPSPPHLESMPRKSACTRSAVNNSESRLPIQHPVSTRTISSPFGVQWNKDGTPQRHHPPFHRRVQSEGFHKPPYYTQLHHSRIKSFNSATSVHSNGIDELAESEVPSSMMRSVMTPVDTSNTWSPVFLPSVSSSAPPAPDSHMCSNFMTGCTDMNAAEILEPNLATFDVNGDSPTLGELPSPLSSRDQVSLFSSPCLSGTLQDVANWSRLQNDVPIVLGLRNHISSLDNELKRSRSTPGNSNPSWNLSQSQSMEEQASAGRVAGSEGLGQDALNLPYSAKTSPHCIDQEALRVTHATSKQTQVMELQECVRDLIDTWKQELESDSELWRRCSVMQAPGLSQNGFRTLKAYIFGWFPQTFEDAFALTTVALATALLLNSQRDSYRWDAFFYDAFDFGHALSHGDDRILFLDAVNHFLRMIELLLPVLNITGGESLGIITPRAPQSYGGQTLPLNILGNSEVYKACTGFLDGFEELSVGERNSQFPPNELHLRAQTWGKDETQHMIKHITQPLQQRRSIKALAKIVTDVELQIDYGLLQTTREVEVTLNTSGRKSSESLEIFEQYFDVVTSQCDEAMRSPDAESSLNWRNYHYIVDVNKVLQILETLDKQQSKASTVEHWIDTNAQAVVRLNPPVFNSPTSFMSSNSNGAGTSGSPSTSVISWRSNGSSPMADASPRAPSSGTPSPASVSPTPLTPDTPTDSVVSCSSCSVEFRGTAQNARSNLNRHRQMCRLHRQRYRRHDRSAGLSCPLEECRARRPMRSDNLNPHLVKKHKMTSLREREKYIDQSWQRARGVNDDGTTRRRFRKE